MNGCGGILYGGMNVVSRRFRSFGTTVFTEITTRSNERNAINLAQGLPKVYCDPEIVELILINFLINAAEAADKKNSWVKLNALLDERLSNALVVEVTDNGSGISERNMGKIFDPFFSTKSSRGGTGMGLYLCLALADQMGARIEVDSRSGQGSTFRLIPNGNEKTTI